MAKEPTPDDMARVHLLACSAAGVAELRAALGGPAMKRFILACRVTEGGCWLWQGDRYSNGYGRFSLGDVEWLAHRLAYACMVGPIAGDLTIDHLCNQRLCVNPDHLSPAARADNTRRGDGSGRRTHCPQGHEYSGENLRVNADGSRHCRACDRERARKKRFADPARFAEINRRSYLKHRERYLARRRSERAADPIGE